MSAAGNAAVLAAATGEVTALAFCWKLVRTDGVVLGFTSHDTPLRVSGILYESRPGMTPSAVSLSSGFEPDSMAVAGAISAAAVRAADLDVGRWDGARVELYCCDWTAPELGLELLMRGFVGDVSRRQGVGTAEAGEYSIELVSEMVRFMQAGAPRSSPTCRAGLGDRRCGVDMAGRRVAVAIAGGEGRTLGLAQDIERPADYALGWVQFVSGPLSGIQRRIAFASERSVTLVRPVWIPGAAGSVVCMTEGCDKRFETCVGRFGNGLAFDGEPHLPGSDALIRYGEA